MIKETDGISMGGSVDEVYCDSCHIHIFSCCDLQWEKGQELLYSPILCESCGRERNKDHGAKTKRVEELEKLLVKK